MATSSGNRRHCSRASKNNAGEYGRGGSPARTFLAIPLGKCALNLTQPLSKFVAASHPDQQAIGLCSPGKSLRRVLPAFER